ncbi:hypothetical protein F2Q69_00016621 [Brassica cretica]|uniref:Transmembrane protein n=1 Tax=Brassica cretica TaxID=69181 RepID=A0A8S9QYU6_BRACR|nr:hypothetical protein F2Q69_00016621 [Brassica cretica]
MASSVEKDHEGTVADTGDQNDSAVVPSETVGGGEKKTTTTKGKGLFSRIWNWIFRVKGDDFEKRLKGISKEEATIRSRMKRRSVTRRKLIRNLIAFSVFFEVIAVSYAVMSTRDEDLDWKLRSFRILPMFLLPALAFLTYSSLVSFTRMCDRRDQNTLEKLQGEGESRSECFPGTLTSPAARDDGGERGVTSVTDSLRSETRFISKTLTVSAVRDGEAETRDGEFDFEPPPRRRGLSSEALALGSDSAAEEERDAFSGGVRNTSSSLMESRLIGVESERIGVRVSGGDIGVPRTSVPSESVSSSTPAKGQLLRKDI